MVELKYYRPERDRLDTVVLMMPDLNATPGLMPTPDEYKVIEERLQKQLADKLAAIEAEQYVPPEKPVDNVKKEESAVETVAESIPAEDANPTEQATNGDGDQIKHEPAAATVSEV